MVSEIDLPTFMVLWKVSSYVREIWSHKVVCWSWRDKLKVVSSLIWGYTWFIRTIVFQQKIKYESWRFEKMVRILERALTFRSGHFFVFQVDARCLSQWVIGVWICSVLAVGFMPQSSRIRFGHTSCVFTIWLYSCRVCCVVHVVCVHVHLLGYSFMFLTWFTLFGGFHFHVLVVCVISAERRYTFVWI